MLPELLDQLMFLDLAAGQLGDRRSVPRPTFGVTGFSFYPSWHSITSRLPSIQTFARPLGFLHRNSLPAGTTLVLKFVAPMHVHHLQDEIVRVEAGRVGYQVLGQEAKIAGPGETVAWPAGIAHKWWNAGDTEARFTGWCIPPGNGEYYLTSIFDSMKQHGGKRPGLFDAAFLTTRYETEFAMVDMPKPVQAILMPLLYALGSLMGKHRKDAPEPVRSM